MEEIKPKDERLAWLNVAEWIGADDGLHAARVPELYRRALPRAAAERALLSAGVELRFKSDTEQVKLKLLQPHVVDFQVATDEWQTVKSEPTGNEHAICLTSENKEEQLWQIRFERGFPLIIKSLVVEGTISPEPLDGKVRLLPNQQKLGGSLALPACPPLKPQRKETRWLAHGSSITQGGSASRAISSYVWQTADILDWTPINIGFGGSCWGDRVSALYIASRDDWDIVSLEIGINSVGHGIDTLRSFELGYDVFLGVIRERHPDKPIVCISPFWCRWDSGSEAGHQVELVTGYRKAIDSIIERRIGEDKNIHFADGRKLCVGPEHLMPDLVHPNDAGMTHIAQNLAPVLKLAEGGA